MLVSYVLLFFVLNLYVCPKFLHLNITPKLAFPFRTILIPKNRFISKLLVTLSLVTDKVKEEGEEGGGRKCERRKITIIIVTSKTESVRKTPHLYFNTELDNKLSNRNRTNRTSTNTKKINSSNLCPGPLTRRCTSKVS